MKSNLLRFLGFATIVFILGGTVSASEEDETIRKTLKFSDPSKTKELSLENIWGSISVVGYEGEEVQLAAQKTVTGKTPRDIEMAKEEVILDISEENNVIEIYVDGPFRDNCRRKRRHRNINYEVHYDFELKVPYKTNLFLRTVNDGNITVKNVTGDFDVENINGGVEMTDVTGSGRAYALNEDLKVMFAENPKSKSYFGSLNGNVDIFFQTDFSADCLVKTFNGDIFTDFQVTYLPRKAGSVEEKKGKYVYKSDGYMGIRIGKGGPEIEFDAFNGDIHIAKRDRK